MGVVSNKQADSRIPLGECRRKDGRKAGAAPKRALALALCVPHGQHQARMRVRPKDRYGHIIRGVMVEWFRQMAGTAKHFRRKQPRERRVLRMEPAVGPRLTGPRARQGENEGKTAL